MTMKRSNVLRLFVLGWMTLVWVLLWGNITVANVAGGGALVAVVVSLVLPLPRVPSRVACTWGRLHISRW